VYARLPSLQQLSVDVNALPAEASSAAGGARHAVVYAECSACQLAFRTL
jgi:hypothetical protein